MKARIIQIWETVRGCSTSKKLIESSRSTCKESMEHGSAINICLLQFITTLQMCSILSHSSFSFFYNFSRCNKTRFVKLKGRNLYSLLNAIRNKSFETRASVWGNGSEYIFISFSQSKNDKKKPVWNDIMRVSANKSCQGLLNCSGIKKSAEK